MSESNSAVLDLQDDSTSEVVSSVKVPDGAEVPEHLIMEEGYDIAVKVDCPQKQMTTMETFVTYRVRCVCARWPTLAAVRRRYNHFKELHRRLSMAYPLIAVPPIPPLHSARQQLDRYDVKFIYVRAIGLNIFLDRVAKHPILTHSEDFRIFLTETDENIDKVFKGEASALNLWGLTSALYGSTSEAKPVNGARVKDPEFTSAKDYLTSLQQKFNSLNKITKNLYKESAALAYEYDSIQTNLPLAEHIQNAYKSMSNVYKNENKTFQAVLPFMSAYAGSHVDKIKARDVLHASHVSGASTDDVHNRLEQSSEALRSELADWNVKTRADTKSLLLDMADKQIDVQRVTIEAWERALDFTKNREISSVFKTVSKAAVQNLSPTKYRKAQGSEPGSSDKVDQEASSTSNSTENYLEDDEDVSKIYSYDDNVNYDQKNKPNLNEDNIKDSTDHIVEVHASNEPLESIDPVKQSDSIDQNVSSSDPVNQSNDQIDSSDPVKHSGSIDHNAIEQDYSFHESEPISNEPINSKNETTSIECNDQIVYSDPLNLITVETDLNDILNENDTNISNNVKTVSKSSDVKDPLQFSDIDLGS